MLILRHQDQARIHDLIRSHLPEAEILAYGSRVKGDCHEGSDLDLALRLPDGKSIPEHTLAGIIEALQESNIPILVEVRDWASLPKSFQEEIARQFERV